MLIKMKYKLFSICLVSLMLSSCEYVKATSSKSSEISSSEIIELNHDEKMEYYQSMKGGNIYTWILENGERKYACLGPGSDFSILYSYNKLSYVQNIAPLNLNEAREYLAWHFEYQGSGYKTYLIEIPYPITEEYYYDNYLFNYPNANFFVQDYSIWEELGYGLKGYDYLKEKGYIK